MPAVNEPHETARFDRALKKWEVVKMWNHQTLYVKATREPYRIGTTISFGLFDGLGALPSWLTDLKPPSEFHVWNEEKNSWVRDEERFRNDIILKRQQERKQLMDEAEIKATGYRDLYLMDHLQDNEKYYFMDLAGYKRALIQLDLTENLKSEINWPPVPTLKPY